jgi:ubiquinone/menaquinone biosynthesis C-methylase UbiE
MALTDIPTGNTYDKYHSRNPLVRKIMAGFDQNLDECLSQCRPANLLDVGTGEGELISNYVRAFGPIPMAAVDLPDPDLATNWKARSTSNVFADAAALPFRDASFDLVTCIEVLEHVPDPEAVLSEISRVAAEWVLLSVPNEPIWRLSNMARGAYLASFGNTPGHVQHWSRKSFLAMVSHHLEIVDSRAPFPWTMALARVE